VVKDGNPKTEGAAGGARTVRGALVAELIVPAWLLAVQDRVRAPAPPAVKVTEALAAPAVMMPPELVQLKVMPAWSGTEAVRPVWPEATGDPGSVMTGVAGAATTVTGTGARVAVAPAPLATEQARVRVPGPPAVKVTVRTSGHSPSW